MTRLLIGGAVALPLMLCATGAQANDTPDAAITHRADSHAPAGVMADHVHKAGQVMIGLTWMHEDAGGRNRRGTSRASDADLVAAGFTARVSAMTMDMAMLHVMWAPSDSVTLMVMPSWQRMEMTMLGIAPSHGADHHAMAVGEKASHRVSGWGDTQFGALVTLARHAGFSAHAGLALSAPTGSVSRRDEDGNFVHYGMQPGSGTWDIIPSLTLRSDAGPVSLGMQASYVDRAEKRNASGFRFGDRFNATGWVARPVGQRLSVSARLAFSHEGRVLGHYNAGHSHAAPPGRQANYGGDRLDAGVGANVMLPGNLRLGLEATLPLYQNVNGYQAPRRFAGIANLSRAF